MQRLTAIGFRWVVKKRTSAKATWDEMYVVNGTSRMGPRHLLSLSAFVRVWIILSRAAQRISWRAAQRFTLWCCCLGWLWWVCDWPTKRFAALKEHFRVTGKAPNRKHVETFADGRSVNLGKWCDTQRWHKKKGRLTAERERLLQVRVPRLHLQPTEAQRNKEYPYRSWLCCRRLCSCSLMAFLPSPIRLRACVRAFLKELGFRWSTNVTANWEDYYAALKEFKKANQLHDPPSKQTYQQADGSQLNLGAW